MTTDSRTNEPTETQVKLAYLAHLKAPRTRGIDVYGPMRAALVAAAGAAPQAECDCGAGPGSAVCKRVCATRAPVQPSSTVDVAALIREAKAEALEEFASQMATGFNPQTLNAERRAIKREARARAAEYREGNET